MFGDHLHESLLNPVVRYPRVCVEVETGTITGRQIATSGYKKSRSGYVYAYVYTVHI